VLLWILFSGSSGCHSSGCQSSGSSGCRVDRLQWLSRRSTPVAVDRLTPVAVDRRQWLLIDSSGSSGCRVDRPPLESIQWLSIDSSGCRSTPVAPVAVTSIISSGCRLINSSGGRSTPVAQWLLCRAVGQLQWLSRRSTPVAVDRLQWLSIDSSGPSGCRVD